MALSQSESVLSPVCSPLILARMPRSDWQFVPVGGLATSGGNAFFLLSLYSPHTTSTHDVHITCAYVICTLSTFYKTFVKFQGPEQILYDSIGMQNFGPLSQPIFRYKKDEAKT